MKPIVGPSSDFCLTPDVIAADIVRHFAPTGCMLDPCKGEGAFLRHMPGSEWCEIREGRDFFEWNRPVDWIVSNPPYSCFRKWLRHSRQIAENIVYLVPVFKATNSCQIWKDSLSWGEVREMRIYINSGIPWQRGRPLCATHWQKGYHGAMDVSYYKPNAGAHASTRSGGPIA
jgi:hypothetical protein